MLSFTGTHVAYASFVSNLTMSRMLRVLIVDESRERALDLCQGVADGGHMVAAVLADASDLADRVTELQPDIVLINTDAPSRDTLEHLATLDRDFPRPVVMFADHGDDDVIRRAMRAGVAAYIVDGLSPTRIEPIMKVAVARFEAFQELRRERDDAERRLTERIAVEKAKGVLMQARGLTEDAAYHALRKLAMERGRRIGEVAQDVLDSAKLLIG